MKIAKVLSAQDVRNLGLGIHHVGGVVGLCIRKQLTTERYFMRFYCGKRIVSQNLPRGITLREARKLGAEIRKQLDQGINPRQELDLRLRSMRDEVLGARHSFRDVVEQWITHRNEMGYWKGREKTLTVVRGRFNKYIYPVIGTKSIADVQTEDLVKILVPVYEKRSMYDKVKALLNHVFSWVKIKKMREDNPMDHVGELLSAMTLTPQTICNRASLDFHEVPMFMKTLMEKQSTACLMLAFSILTAARSQAVRLATWKEIDFQQKKWVIPIEHDKVKGNINRVEEILLSDEAISVLKKIKDRSVDCKDGDLIFKNNRHTSFSDVWFGKLIDQLHKEKQAKDGIGWVDKKTSQKITQHGFRSSFKTWAVSDELGNNRRFDYEISERCLLHKKKDRYNGAYNRCDYLIERTALMSAWGRWCWRDMDAY